MEQTIDPALLSLSKSQQPVNLGPEAWESQRRHTTLLFQFEKRSPDEIVTIMKEKFGYILTYAMPRLPFFPSTPFDHR